VLPAAEREPYSIERAPVSLGFPRNPRGRAIARERCVRSPQGWRSGPFRGRVLQTPLAERIAAYSSSLISVCIQAPCGVDRRSTARSLSSTLRNETTSTRRDQGQLCRRAADPYASRDRRSSSSHRGGSAVCPAFECASLWCGYPCPIQTRMHRPQILVSIATAHASEWRPPPP
jgi:hypothetical protein